MLSTYKIAAVTGIDRRAAQPEGLLEDREEEHADERTEFPDAGRDAVAGGADPGGEQFAGQDEGRDVRAELGAGPEEAPTVPSGGALGRRRASRNSCWTSRVERQWRWPDGDQGCTRTLPLSGQASDSDREMVAQ